MNAIIDLYDTTLGTQSFSNLTRIGRKQQNRIRPIKITFDNMDVKRKILGI